MPAAQNPVWTALQALGVRVPPPSAGTLPAGNEEAGSILGVPERSVFDSPQRRLLRGLDYLLRMGKGAVLGGSEAPGRTPENAGETLTTGIAALGPALAKIVYHGSPHLFDKFDMSKVGTGEGAQLQGHGLYFADLDAVGENYRKAGVGYGSSLPRAERPPGYLYDVDLPDEAIANMLDWDAPLSQQTDAVKKAAKKFGIGDLKADQNISGEEIYRRIARKLSAGQTRRLAPDMQGGYDVPVTNDALASEFLRKRGVAGTKYYDGGSRPTANGHIVEMVADDGSVVNSFRYRTAEEAKAAIPQLEKQSAKMGYATKGRYVDNSGPRGEGTRNYVVFDDQLPKIVKVTR